MHSKQASRDAVEYPHMQTFKKRLLDICLAQFSQSPIQSGGRQMELIRSCQLFWQVCHKSSASVVSNHWAGEQTSASQCRYAGQARPKQPCRTPSPNCRCLFFLCPQCHNWSPYKIDDSLVTFQLYSYVIDTWLGRGSYPKPYFLLVPFRLYIMWQIFEKHKEQIWHSHLWTLALV